MYTSDVLDSDHTESDEFVIAFLTIEGLFSNWSAHQIGIWGMHFATIEHAYQYQKFADGDPAWAQKVKAAKSPWEAKRLGREREADMPDWHERRRTIMRELLSAKITQHEDVRQALLDTDSRVIVEKGNPDEEFWGIGKHNSGLNTLGKLWMELRQELKEHAPNAR